MSAALRNYVIAMVGLDRAIRSVPPSAWDNPSPCEGWTTRDVAGHAIGVVANIGAKLGIREPVDIFGGELGAILGDDPAVTSRHIRDEVLEALDQPGALATKIVSSRGEMTIDDYLAFLLADSLIHTWDIARAAGIDEDLDPTLVGVVADAMLGTTMTRTPGGFGEAESAPEDASLQDRLIAFSGRRP